MDNSSWNHLLNPYSIIKLIMVLDHDLKVIAITHKYDNSVNELLQTFTFISSCVALCAL
jgi:hypothetical protein